MPHGILVDWQGLVYVCARENSCIQVFSADREPIIKWTGVQ